MITLYKQMCMNNLCCYVASKNRDNVFLDNNTNS